MDSLSYYIEHNNKLLGQLIYLVDTLPDEDIYKEVIEDKIIEIKLFNLKMEKDLDTLYRHN